MGGLGRRGGVWASRFGLKKGGDFPFLWKLHTEILVSVDRHY